MHMKKVIIYILLRHEDVETKSKRYCRPHSNVLEFAPEGCSTKAA